MRGLRPSPYFASGEALGTTKETGDRHRPVLRTHCEKFALCRCISAGLRNTQELKGIRAEKPLWERGEIILFAEAGWELFNRMTPSTPTAPPTISIVASTRSALRCLGLNGRSEAGVARRWRFR